MTVGGFSPLYSSELLFHLQRRIEYGRRYHARYEAIAELIPEGTRVVDVCCGDCWLYLKHLRKKGVDYLGLDIAPAWVRRARKRNINARVFNLWDDPVPTGDWVLMQASLYQFDPDTEEVVRRLVEAARDQAVIAEPIRNMTDSKIPLLGALAGFLTRPAGRKPSYTGKRFTETTLRTLFDQIGGLERAFLIPGEQEMVGVFKGACQT